MEDETKPALVSMEDERLAPVMAGTAWLTSDELAGRISANRSGCVDTMARWTREGRLFAMDMGDKRVYPAYAFDAAGEPLPVIKRVLQNLFMHDSFSLACWFESPNTYLDGSRPRDMLVTDPERVVAAAEAQCHCYGQPRNLSSATKGSS
jgi:hypothetical protein